MNLARGEKMVLVLAASKKFAEINPSFLELDHLNLAVKRKSNGLMDGEMTVGYSKGTCLYKFTDLTEAGLAKAKLAFFSLARVTNQPGVFREYDFSDCLTDEEMRFRLLLIPEFDSQKVQIDAKVVSIHEIKNRNFRSKAASFITPLYNGTTDNGFYQCPIHYINRNCDYIRTHITCIQVKTDLLGGVYALINISKPILFNVIVNKPWGVKMNEACLDSPLYKHRQVSSSDIELLKDNGCRLSLSSYTEPYLIVSFPVLNHTCLEEIGSHVNYILTKYNKHIEQCPNQMW